MKSIHDNVINSYCVDFDDNSVIINSTTESGDSVKLLFSDALAHKFEHAMKGSIILDVAESSVDKFMLDNKAVLEKGFYNGWPVDFKSLEELKKVLVDGNYKYYILMSSYGLSGWLLAKGYNTY